MRGKAGRKDQLPLPVEVGKALVDYLRHDRPSCECRCLILTLYAPPRRIHPSTITNVVYRACQRAGWRESAPTDCVMRSRPRCSGRAATCWKSPKCCVSRTLGTTAGYAKVDRVALRSVAAGWPGTAA